MEGHIDVRQGVEHSNFVGDEQIGGMDQELGGFFITIKEHYVIQCIHSETNWMQALFWASYRHSLHAVSQRDFSDMHVLLVFLGIHLVEKVIWHHIMHIVYYLRSQDKWPFFLTIVWKTFKILAACSATEVRRRQRLSRHLPSHFD